MSSLRIPALHFIDKETEYLGNFGQGQVTSRLQIQGPHPSVSDSRIGEPFLVPSMRCPLGTSSIVLGTIWITMSALL